MEKVSRGVETEALPRQPPELILSHISHVLRLQLLGTQLATNVQSAFATGYLFIPRTQIKKRPVVLAERCPHKPPAVGRVLQNSAVGASTAIEIVGDREVGAGSMHHGVGLSWPTGRELGAPILANMKARSTMVLQAQ
jgi:hypothetical protein